MQKEWHKWWFWETLLPFFILTFLVMTMNTTSTQNVSPAWWQTPDRKMDDEVEDGLQPLLTDAYSSPRRRRSPGSKRSGK
jgi:hypothetical protein